MKKAILMFFFSLFFGAIGSTFAHEGHKQKVKAIGTVSSVDKTHVEVKATDGKIVSVEFSPETTFHQGEAPATSREIKVGERAVVTYMVHDGKNLAHEIQLPPAKKKKSK